MLLEAIALHTWPSSFLRRAGSIVQRHNTNIKYNFNNTYILKSKTEDIWIFVAYLSLGRLSCSYSLPIYILGVIRRRLICLSNLHGDIGRFGLSNKLLDRSSLAGAHLYVPLKSAYEQP